MINLSIMILKILEKKLESFKYQFYNFYLNSKKDTCIKFENTSYNRIDVLKYIQNKIKKSNENFSYLEIGVQNETVFKEIITSNKIGIDPFSGGTHKMTSDNFFAQNDKFFDLIFIDGLHEYDQCKNDLINSLKFLNPNGLIVFHDFVPKNYLENAIPRKSKTWTGDVWKLGVQLTYSENCDFFVANFDHGIGILKVKDNFSLKNLKNIKNFTFSDFENHFYYEIPLRSYNETLEKIDKYFKK